MSRDDLVTEIRYSLDYVRSNLYELGPKLWTKEERDEIRDLISGIREYINDKYANPPLSWVYKQIVGGNRYPIDVLFSKALSAREGSPARRKYPQVILDRLGAAVRDWSEGEK